MVDKLSFKNQNSFKIEVLVEPAAEYIDLNSGESISIELEKLSSKFEDEFSMVLAGEILSIYEVRQCSMKIYKSGKLVYYS